MGMMRRIGRKEEGRKRIGKECRKGKRREYIGGGVNHGREGGRSVEGGDSSLSVEKTTLGGS